MRQAPKEEREGSTSGVHERDPRDTGTARDKGARVGACRAS